LWEGDGREDDAHRVGLLCSQGATSSASALQCALEPSTATDSRGYLAFARSERGGKANDFVVGNATSQTTGRKQDGSCRRLRPDESEEASPRIIFLWQNRRRRPESFFFGKIDPPTRPKKVFSLCVNGGPGEPRGEAHSPGGGAAWDSAPPVRGDSRGACSHEPVLPAPPAPALPRQYRPSEPPPHSPAAR